VLIYGAAINSSFAIKRRIAVGIGFGMAPLSRDLYNAKGASVMTVAVSENGWVVIPAELRKKHNLIPGTEVQEVDYGGVLALVPKLSDPIHQAAGMLKGRKSLRRALLAEHRIERKGEKTRGC
jgi:AbrB family looped-hinge helix DNA binding protein